jgi:hypothetical protein
MTKLLSLWVGVAALGLVALSSSAAWAQQDPSCGADGSCPSGRHCEQRNEPGACPACPSADCPPCEPVTPVDVCVVDRVACATDDDCPGYLVCLRTNSQTSCDGCESEAPLPADATHTCVFMERTCEQESDCADGLRCLPSTDSICSGTAGGEVECTPDPRNICTFQAIACQTTADCPHDFLCEDTVTIECAQSGAGCAVPHLFCAPRGVAFGVAADGSAAYAETVAVYADSAAPPAADGRGNTESVAASGSDTSADDAGCAIAIAQPASSPTTSSPTALGFASLAGLLLACGFRRRQTARGPRA